MAIPPRVPRDPFIATGRFDPFSARPVLSTMPTLITVRRWLASACFCTLAVTEPTATAAAAASLSKSNSPTENAKVRSPRDELRILRGQELASTIKGRSIRVQGTTAPSSRPLFERFDQDGSYTRTNDRAIVNGIYHIERDRICVTVPLFPPEGCRQYLKDKRGNVYQEIAIEGIVHRNPVIVK